MKRGMDKITMKRLYGITLIIMGDLRIPAGGQRIMREIHAGYRGPHYRYSRYRLPADVHYLICNRTQEIRE